MTTDEKLALLRGRITTLEEGIQTFLGVLEATGTQRKAAFDEQRSARNADWPLAACAFLATYERTMPEREAAAQALLHALGTDFRTALVSCDDLTPEQEAHWRALTEPEHAEKETA